MQTVSKSVSLGSTGQSLMRTACVSLGLKATWNWLAHLPLQRLIVFKHFRFKDEVDSTPSLKLLLQQLAL